MIKFKIILANFISYVFGIKLYYFLSYFHNRKKILNIKKPQNLSEYIISNIVLGKINTYAEYTDKYRVREYVKSKNLTHILPKFYGVWKDVEKIEYTLLPEKFALKLNFGCGFNIICFDKNSFDFKSAKEQLSVWMSQKIFWRAEPHYDLVDRHIICEEFIEDSKGVFPIDYKFMCINGKPDHILVVFDRDSEYKLLTYDLEWNKIGLLTDDNLTDSEIDKPTNLLEMIQCAKILSCDFDFVRVDLYDTGERVIFGELTFTPQGGLLRYYNLNALERMNVVKKSNIYGKE